MTTTKSKGELLVTPEGTAAYAWLNKPDEAFGQNKYKLTLLLEKNAANTKFVKQIEKMHKDAAGTTNTPSPVKDGDKSDKDGWENHWAFTAKSNYKPKVVDSTRQDISNEREFPMSGDLVKMAIKVLPYEAGKNAGVSLVLNAVQLIDKRNVGSGIAQVFPEVEGFIAASETEVSSEEVFDW
tara:strand:+ start:141 stop:686 length:546 start_codon:yes stop_codon:yes gene_type:complete